MTLIVIVLFSGLLTLGFTGRSSTHPGADSLLKITSVENIECREDAGPDSALEAPAPTRAANLRLSGQYTCHRPVFSAEERNPYIEKVLSAQSVIAKRVANNLKLELKQVPPAGLGFSVEGLEEPRLQDKVQALYQVELLAVLGRGALLRSGENRGATPFLKIQFFKTDATEQMSKAELRTKNARGETIWRAI